MKTYGELVHTLFYCFGIVQGRIHTFDTWGSSEMRAMVPKCPSTRRYFDTHRHLRACCNSARAWDTSKWWTTNNWNDRWKGWPRSDGSAVMFGGMLNRHINMFLHVSLRSFWVVQHGKAKTKTRAAVSFRQVDRCCLWTGILLLHGRFEALTADWDDPKDQTHPTPGRNFPHVKRPTGLKSYWAWMCFFLVAFNDVWSANSLLQLNKLL